MNNKDIIKAQLIGSGIKKGDTLLVRAALRSINMREKSDFALSWDTYTESSKRIASTEKLLRWIKQLYV